MKALKGMSGIEKREREARNCEMEMKSARRNGHLARGKSIGSSSRRTKKKMSLNKYYSSFSVSPPSPSLCPFDYSPPFDRNGMRL